MVYILNWSSFIVSTLYIVYFMVGLVLKFFKYKSILVRFYPDVPILPILFLFSVGNSLYFVSSGISDSDTSLGTIIIITLMIFAFILNVLKLLYMMKKKISQIRSRFPER